MNSRRIESPFLALGTEPSYAPMSVMVLLILLTVAPLAMIVTLVITDAHNAFIPYIACSIWAGAALVGLFKQDFRELSLQFIAYLLAPFFIAGCVTNGLEAVVALPFLILIPIVTLQGSRRIAVASIYLAGPILLALFGKVTDWKLWYTSVIISLSTAVVVYLFISSLERTLLSLDNKARALELLKEKQERVFATIGHELRTPAATVKMLIDEEVALQKSENLTEAQKVSSHLLSILDDMRISISPATLTEFVQSETVFSVFETLERSIRGVSRLAEEMGVKIQLEGKRIHRLGHLGSPKSIQQIIQNLLRNAVLHSRGDQVKVRLDFEHLSKDRTLFSIAVIDNGTGISPNVSASMFEAFERGDTDSEGSGLGLFISQNLAKELPSGNLNYKRNPTGGSIFELSFELEKCMKEPEHTPSRQGASPLNGLSILLVEDTKTLRLLGKTVLERCGAVVEVAEDGTEALRAMKLFQPDLILTDINMPNMNGYQLTSSLRDQGFSKPIIGITAATVGMEADTLIECGANKVLAKPLTRESVEAALLDLSRQP